MSYERGNTKDAENYLVISRSPDDPDALVHQLNAKIVRISVTGGASGQVTAEMIRGLIGGSGGTGGR